MERIISAERVEDILNVFGSFDQNLHIIEKEWNVCVTDRDAELKISGEPEDVVSAEKAVQNLLMLAARGETVDEQRVRYVIGMIRSGQEDQIRELRRIAATGVNAVVMISNRLASPNESDDALIARMKTILDAIPGVTFGMYECPYPYKRMLTPKVLEAMAETGRFTFIKDTCCDAELIAERIKLLDGRIQLFNANCATALETFESGADGFSGIMANYHPDLLVWLYENFRAQPEKARPKRGSASTPVAVNTSVARHRSEKCSERRLTRTTQMMPAAVATSSRWWTSESAALGAGSAST